MGKDTDKLYITQSEWTQFDFGHGGFKARKTGKEFKRLPFSCCALSLTPFEHPRCSKDGIIFDLIHILPWLKKYGTNPVTGEKLASKDLIALHFHKNSAGEYHDPVTFKVFTENTRIVAVATSGQVYAADTIEELNFKTKNWRDLMTDEPFTKKDIITIQAARDINKFHHVLNDLQTETTKESAEEQKRKQVSNTINAKGAMARVLGAIEDKKPKPTQAKADQTPITPAFVQKKSKAYNEAHFSYNDAAGAFTSMGAVAVTENTAARFTDDAFLIMNVKEKAYARIRTNLGDLNLELYCKDAPKTCLNFVMLAKQGYYKDVIFHRSIKNFMLQGGDPTGTGRGGKSYFGEPFEDEIKPNLSHSERGILSMANKGKGTNTSQFFITYRACTHLDKKHTVFGKLVGGADVLSVMEKISTDDDDRPKSDIKMLDVEILVDPFEQLLKSVTEKKEPVKKPKIRDVPAPAAINSSDSIGKYLTTPSTSKRTSEQTDNIPEKVDGKKKGRSGFGDFSSW
ncbi:RING-type E3 ubiquitin-protein ligase ppil2 [Phlyctochytrium planicorne]|nr:RING-type E3 ubiquitin-protein ligase ppil2 [Phlyctochytrium planicorne]